MMSQRQVRKRAVNLSETVENRLHAIVRAEQEKRWREDNRDAIASINSFIEQHGLLAAKLRYRPQ